VTTFKISKKISQAFLPCWQWTQAKKDFKKKMCEKQQISKNNTFQKQHILENNTFQKQQQI
jgi:hypothetical protein